MLSIERICDLPQNYRPYAFRVKWADSAWEIAGARRLRRDVFCEEQGVFVDDDIDAIDTQAQALVAVSQLGGMPDQVVGTVRIHSTDPGLWWGSRLAVDVAFRHHSGLGATLIRLAVTSAHARGCRIFLAHVQSQNTPMFKRLHWQALQHETLHGRAHDLMQADLLHYPPCYDPIWGYSVLGRSES
jgi:putative N-acetyltransferase (TIGR04045 family)